MIRCIEVSTTTPSTTRKKIQRREVLPVQPTGKIMNCSNVEATFVQTTKMQTNLKIN